MATLAPATFTIIPLTLSSLTKPLKYSLKHSESTNVFEYEDDGEDLAVRVVVIVAVFFPLFVWDVVDIDGEFLIVDPTVKIRFQFPHLHLALLAVLEFLHEHVHVFEHEHCGDVQNIVVRGLWYEYNVVVVIGL